MVKGMCIRAMSYSNGRRKRRKCLAFVLGGGGARGALQVGAMRALFEAGLKPDLLVGTSIGAVNATGLALWGVDLNGLDVLERTWRDAADAYLLDPRLSRLLLRCLLGRPNTRATQQIAQFFASKGITSDVRFEHIEGVRLGMVGSDLDAGQPVIYGTDPTQSVLEGLLASIALPPWFAPVEKEGRHIVDGGFLSNLPIEPALTMGATEIIALDLNEMDTLSGYWGDGFVQYVEKLSYALNLRHVALETALAKARGVPVRHVQLKCPTQTPLWDFDNYQELIRTGYEIAKRAVPT